MSILSHGFHPGVTVLALLAESHVAIHTWCEEGGAEQARCTLLPVDLTVALSHRPEHRYAAVDVVRSGLRCGRLVRRR
jgi:S-adenosylmethionine/arginine decarboxylase-like enzyme